MEEPIKTEIKRNPDGTFAEGSAPGPGRPKGKTLKEYAREMFMLKTDEEKRAYLEWLEEKKPGFAWTMSEGNPSNDSKIDVTTKGEKVGSLPPEAIAIIEEDLKKKKLNAD